VLDAALPIDAAGLEAWAASAAKRADDGVLLARER
jgi:hypothetical protein